MTRPREAQLPLLLTMSEGLSRGADEMVPISRTDSMHAPSCGLAIRDAVEEIKWLRAEVERLRAALKLYAHQYCEFDEAFEGCGKMPDDDCGGCRARAALEAKP
jgi:hypothetical protein